MGISATHAELDDALGLTTTAGDVLVRGLGPEHAALGDGDRKQPAVANPQIKSGGGGALYVPN